MLQATIESNNLVREVKPAKYPTSITVPSAAVGTRATASVEFTLNSPQSSKRVMLEQFIANRFSEAYGAAIVEFFPLLLSRSDDSQVSSVVGLRPGTERPLFLEQYLQKSLEQSISEATGELIARDSIMEIGNLASACKSGSQLMFVLLTAVLAKADYKWVVFTATDQIRLLLSRLQFEPVTLCEADSTRLVNKNQSWGTYYQSQPKVQAGNVPEALRILKTSRFAAALIEKHAQDIDELANALKKMRSTKVKG